MKLDRFLASVVAAVALLASGPAHAQQPRRPEQPPRPAPQSMEVRVYNVADIVGLRPDYPYRGAILPTTLGENSGLGAAGVAGGMMGGFGGGGGGGLGGMGGGFFQIADPGGSDPGALPALPQSNADASAPRVTIDDLIDAIQTTIEAEWEEIDGVGGAIARLGATLIIRQTPSAHEQIQSLLTGLGTAGGALSTVTINAHWLLLGSDDLARLVPPPDERATKSTRIDPAGLQELVGQSGAYRARITCFSDQTVHIVSGTRRTVVTGAVPTVGMGTAAYTPFIAYPNVGVLLQVRPSLLPDRRSAILNVTSTVTGWEDAGAPLRIGTAFLPGEKEGVSFAGGRAETSIDRVNMPTQHLETALRLPLGEPTLVGGMNLPEGGAAEKEKQLYLIVEITADQP